jgi:hypothetical protein
MKKNTAANTTFKDRLGTDQFAIVRDNNAMSCRFPLAAAND